MTGRTLPPLLREVPSPAVAGRVSPARRGLDVVASSIGLVVLAPVFVAVAAAVRVTSRGPVIFHQTRLTTGRRQFTMYKFRTMRVAAAGPELTAKGDTRVTRIGSVLRRTSLDELPQLVNVLRGEMTLVGPRPETAALAGRYPAHLQWVLDCTPGLTGPSQVRLRDRAELPDAMADPETWYLEHLVPARVETDLSYLSSPSLGATLRLLGETVRYLMSRG